jgi:hypothetical protein
MEGYLLSHLCPFSIHLSVHLVKSHALHLQAPPWPGRHARYLVLRLLRAGNGAGVVSSDERCRVGNDSQSFSNEMIVGGASAVFLLNGEADRDSVNYMDGPGNNDIKLSTSPSSTALVDQRAVGTANELCDESDGARGDSHGSDHGGLGDAMAGSGNDDEDPGNSDLASSCRAVITPGHHEEGVVRPEGTAVSGHGDTDGSGMYAENLGEVGEGFPIPVAAVQATVEGVGRRIRSPCRSAGAIGFENRNGPDAVPHAAAAALCRDDSAFSMIDPDGTGDFEAIAVDFEEDACERAVVEGAETARVAETAALLAVYLRRVQPCRESLDRRVQSAGAALLRSDLGSALFTRFVWEGFPFRTRPHCPQSSYYLGFLVVLRCFAC